VENVLLYVCVTEIKGDKKISIRFFRVYIQFDRIRSAWKNNHHRIRIWYDLTRKIRHWILSTSDESNQALRQFDRIHALMSTYPCIFLNNPPSPSAYHDCNRLCRSPFCGNAPLSSNNSPRFVVFESFINNKLVSEHHRKSKHHTSILISSGFFYPRLSSLR
jgi:hypothetical protein